MSEREAVKQPKCPVCGYPDAARLAPSDTCYRWQCRSLDCMHQWTTPREISVSDRVAEERRRRAMTADEVAKMATGKAKLKCEKCGRPYQRGGKKFEAHVRDCDGKGERRPPKATRASRAKPSASNGDGNVFELALAPLRTRREEILAGIPELVEIDSAIAAIEKVKGGGEVPKPFVRRNDHDGSVEEDPELP